MTDDSCVSGSCLCGEVRFRVRLPSVLCAHCHCSICRRAHGAAFVTWLAVPKESMSIVEGHDKLKEFASSDHALRTFCSRCGSPLFTQSTLHRPDQIDIVVASLHDPIDRDPQLHVFFDDRAEWAHVEDDLPKFGGPTGFEPIGSGPLSPSGDPV